MRFAARQGFALSGFFILRVIHGVRVFGFSFQVIVSRGLSQVGRDRRAKALRLRVLSSAMLGRHVVGEALTLKGAARVGGRLS